VLNVLDGIRNGERPLRPFGKIARQCGPDNEIESLRSAPCGDVDNAFGLRAFACKIKTCHVSPAAAFTTSQVGDNVVSALSLTEAPRNRCRRTALRVYDEGQRTQARARNAGELESQRWPIEPPTVMVLFEFSTTFP
jgi:hypothetical protein